MVVLFEHWRDVPAGFWQWPNFEPWEIACKGTGSLLVDFDALDKLQAMRIAADRAFIITSAYRSPFHNARVGGAPRSFHKYGKAFDIRLAGHSKPRMMRLAEQVGFGGIAARGNSFIHVDTGRKRSWQY
jgi:uncharacterized protein YcbK (DUF882 family)